MKALSLIFLIFACLFNSAHALEAKAVIEKVKNSASPPHERVRMRLILEAPDAPKKERLLTITRRNDVGSSRALIRLLEPADIKGLSLLSVVETETDEQWIYTPSSKQLRRIVGGNRKGKFLDSDITYEDLRADTYSEFRNKILKETPKSIEMESLSLRDAESSYGKILTWISIPEFRVEKVEYFDLSMKLLKSAVFKNYKKIDGKYWRARSVTVENFQEKTKTRLIVEKISTKKIADNEVSLAAMEE